MRKEFFALYAAPGVNLFEKRLDRIPVKSNQNEYLVVPDRSRLLEFETNRIVRVFAHIPGAPQKVPVEPLYSATAARSADRTQLHHPAACRAGARSRKKNTVRSPTMPAPTSSCRSASAPISTRRGAWRSSASTRFAPTAISPNICRSARAGPIFGFLDDVDLEVRCLAGPTRPLEPTLTALDGKGENASTGEVAWRLVNMLSLNHLGLVDRAAGDSAKALARDAGPVRRSRRQRDRAQDPRRPQRRRAADRAADASGRRASAAARGLEITVLLDEKAFEGSGAFLLGAVLDRFFAEYVAINHFTQTVVRTHGARRDHALAAAAGPAEACCDLPL